MEKRKNINEQKIDAVTREEAKRKFDGMSKKEIELLKKRIKVRQDMQRWSVIKSGLIMMIGIFILISLIGYWVVFELDPGFFPFFILSIWVTFYGLRGLVKQIKFGKILKKAMLNDAGSLAEIVFIEMLELYV